MVKKRLLFKGRGSFAVPLLKLVPDDNLDARGSRGGSLRFRIFRLAWVYVVADIGALHPKNHVLGNVRGVIGYPLEIAGYQQRAQSLPHYIGALVHGLDQLDESARAHWLT